jgi:signal transduction histidine kinase
MAGAVPRIASKERSVRIHGLAQPLRHLRRISPLAVDAGLGAIYVLIVAVEATAEPMAGARLGLLPALTLVMAACITLRRRIPLAAQVIATAALTAESFLHVATEFSPLATLVCAYSVGQYATPTRARWGALITVAGVVGFFAATPGLRRTDPANLISVLLVWLVAWGLGYSAARRRDEQERARRALERQVIAEERVRVSRELHDVLGHTVNLFVVQAGAARLMLDSDPAMTRSLLQGMENTGRATLADLDRVLASLRSDPTDVSQNGAGPAPGLTQLPELVGRFQDSGIDVRLTVDPNLRLPRDLDLSVYRIVQEALTNTLKHAAPCSATVIVQRTNGSLIVEISDNGPGVRATDRHGRGLVGIAERVSMSGGVLEHGNGRSGGFRLRAVLPVQ